MAATMFFSFGLKTQFPHRTIRSATVPSTPFINKQTLSLNLSSWNSIPGLPPLVLSRTSTMGSPVHRYPQPLTVVCASGYKMKTHKASAKRFRVSGSGKIMRRRAGKQHLLRKKNTKRRLRLSKMV
ncbi:60S ribosomal protein L35 [Orobanche hederae]